MHPSQQEQPRQTIKVLPELKTRINNSWAWKEHQVLAPHFNMWCQFNGQLQRTSQQLLKGTENDKDGLSLTAHRNKSTWPWPRRLEINASFFILVTFCSPVEENQIKTVRIRKLTWLGRHCWFPCGQGRDTSIPQSKLKFQFQLESPEILQSESRKRKKKTTSVTISSKMDK